MRVVNLGVRNHCVLQQISAGARLGLTRETHSRVPKTCRQEPYSESTVWVKTLYRMIRMVYGRANQYTEAYGCEKQCTEWYRC